MGFILVGKVVAINEQETVASKSDSTKTFARRQLYLDCSRYDSITGERLQDNFPLLEFGGKGLEQLNELCRNGLKKGDLVQIEFAVQGSTYKDAQGVTKNYTGIRPYGISRYVPKGQQSQQSQQSQTQHQGQAQQSQNLFPQSQGQSQGQGQGGADDLPF